MGGETKGRIVLKIWGVPTERTVLKIGGGGAEEEEEEERCHDRVKRNDVL